MNSKHPDSLILHLPCLTPLKFQLHVHILGYFCRSLCQPPCTPHARLFIDACTHRKTYGNWSLKFCTAIDQLWAGWGFLGKACKRAQPACPAEMDLIDAHARAMHMSTRHEVCSDWDAAANGQLFALCLCKLTHRLTNGGQTTSCKGQL